MRQEHVHVDMVFALNYLEIPRDSLSSNLHTRLLEVLHYAKSRNGMKYDMERFILGIHACRMIDLNMKYIIQKGSSWR